MRWIYRTALLGLFFAVPANGQSGIATVHFYALDKFGVRHLPVYVDEKEVGTLHGRDKIEILVTPGKHTIHSSDKESGVILDLTEGGEYYVRVTLSRHGFPPPGRVDLIDPGQGKFEFDNMKKK